MDSSFKLFDVLNKDIAMRDENNKKQKPCAVWKVRNEYQLESKKIETSNATRTTVTSEAMTFTLPRFEPPPLMWNWIPIPRNSVTKDSERLPHKPQLSGHESSSELTSESHTQNIDNPMDKILQPDDSMRSYRRLFCRRCSMYNCDLHMERENSPKKTNLQSSNVTEPELSIPTPCSNNCYIVKDDKSENKKKRSAAAEGRETIVNVENDANNGDEWSCSDQTLFLNLLRVFPDNYCKIAEVMIKSCQQVYNHIRSSDVSFDVKSPNITKKTENHRENRKPYVYVNPKQHIYNNHTPCDHEGHCYKNPKCSCVNCENFCNCGDDCSKRHQACKCKTTCIVTQCKCFTAHRECDPQKCTNCSVSCKNKGLQRGLEKKLLIISSPIHGWGIAVKEVCQRGELICEYRGELISQKEAKRREQEYDENYTYMFEWNNEYVLDATRFGSKIRFANQPKLTDQPNCKFKKMMVNGDHRMGVYALRMIEKGEELTVNYNLVYKNGKVKKL